MKKQIKITCRPFLSAVIFSMVSIIAFLNVQLSEAGFFEQNSTWYEKIPSNPKIAANSDNNVKDILLNKLSWQTKGTFAVSRAEWGVPIWYARADTPVVTVDTRSDTRPALYGWNTVPIPPEAKPASEKDGHMVVISHDGKYEWDFYRAKKDSSGKWFASHLRRWDLSTNGVNSPYDFKGMSRACPIPLTHGLITYDEIQRGHIDHAMAFAYWHAKKEPHMGIYPCGHYRGGLSYRSGAMLFGERLQLDPRIDVNSLPLTRAGKIVAKAMQEYGMIFIEGGGSGYNSVYAESLDDKPTSWVNSFNSAAAIPLDKLRVVEPIYPSAVIGALTPPSNLRITE